MQVYLDSYGAYLGVQNGMFWVKPLHHAGRALPIRQVNAIFLTRGVRMSTDAMLLALENSIPVLLIDAIGHPLGQLWSGQFGSIATIRRQQALFAYRAEGWQWIRDVLVFKIRRQKALLESLSELPHEDDLYRRRWRRTLPVLHFIIRNLENWAYDEQPEPAATFRGWEGTATRQYFGCISAALPLAQRFKGRSQRPATDPFNCVLNYLYGMLYAMVELSLMKAGIDPYLGVLHVDRHAQPTMVFDYIEQYRHWADEVAVRLFREEQFPAETFLMREDGGYWLEAPGKHIVIEAMMQHLEEPVERSNRRYKRLTLMDLDAQSLASLLKQLK